MDRCLGLILSHDEQKRPISTARDSFANEMKGTIKKPSQASPEIPEGESQAGIALINRPCSSSSLSPPEKGNNQTKG